MSNTCEVCGNEYELAFEVITAGHHHVFDCFECAIHALAPVCDRCGCVIVGHGMQAGERMFCCAHCAQASGVSGLADRIGAGSSTETAGTRGSADDL